jgi:1,2-phenylacetyl-CoA epoxidase PaaB subunit
MTRRADVVSLAVVRRSAIWYLIDTQRPQWKDINGTVGMEAMARVGRRER